MTQEYHKQQLQERMMTTSTMGYLLYLNKTVISLDYIQIRNVVDEEIDQLLLIDSNYTNKFSLPSCKISVDKTDANSLIVDLEYQEAGRYRIIE